MTAVAGLKRLGFTENEAKVYLSLLRHPGSTGYEASRNSGVPRAKVYEVLEGLVKRGAVLAENAEERTLYRALSYTVLLQEFRRSTDQLMTDLYRELSRLVPDSPGPYAVTVHGLTRAMARTADLITGAKESILAVGRPDELQHLAHPLADAERRGVHVQALSYGPVRLPLAEIFVQAPRKGDQILAVLADQQKLCLMDLGAPDGGYAVLLSTRDIGMAMAGWIRREIALGEIERLVGERLGDMLPAAALQQMQRLWRS